MTAVFRILCLAMLLAFGLVACGGDDSESESAPAATSSTDESMDSSMEIEKAEGVIYQDEIYANWPYN